MPIKRFRQFQCGRLFAVYNQQIIELSHECVQIVFEVD